jgi:hypothetical protein
VRRRGERCSLRSWTGIDDSDDRSQWRDCWSHACLPVYLPASADTRPSGGDPAGALSVPAPLFL